MIYKIKNQFLEVINEIKEHDQLIYGRFSQFQIKSNITTTNYLKFKKNTVELYINGDYKILKNKIVKTDIYPIINNVIAYLINDEKNMFIHAITVSKNNKGILIIGDFGQGKTTLSQEFKKNEYEINSTDQTWITVDDNNVYQKLGSSFDIQDEKIQFLDECNFKKNIKIEKVIQIVGLCDNGDSSYIIKNNKYHIIKSLAYFCNWNYFMPIFTDNIELFNTNKYVMDFLKLLVEKEIEVIEVRGDKSEILKKVEGVK